MTLSKKVLISIIILLTIMVICLILEIPNKVLKIMYPETYSNIVEIYANKYNVDDKLILALIKAESNFDQKAVSNKSAKGLMQLMEDTAEEIIKKSKLDINLNNISEELFVPENNINVGTKYLATLIERYNNTELALTAYNAGIGNVDKWIEQGILKKDGSNIENIPYKETNNYVRSILRDYKIYCNLYNS